MILYCLYFAEVGRELRKPLTTSPGLDMDSSQSPFSLYAVSFGLHSVSTSPSLNWPPFCFCTGSVKSRMVLQCLSVCAHVYLYIVPILSPGMHIWPCILGLVHSALFWAYSANNHLPNISVVFDMHATEHKIKYGV